jgi:hypothetical protein
LHGMCEWEGLHGMCEWEGLHGTCACKGRVRVWWGMGEYVFECVVCVSRVYDYIEDDVHALIFTLTSNIMLSLLLL